MYEQNMREGKIFEKHTVTSLTTNVVIDEVHPFLTIT